MKMSFYLSENPRFHPPDDRNDAQWLHYVDIIPILVIEQKSWGADIILSINFDPFTSDLSCSVFGLHQPEQISECVLLLPVGKTKKYDISPFEPEWRQGSAANIGTKCLGERRLTNRGWCTCIHRSRRRGPIRIHIFSTSLDGLGRRYCRWVLGPFFTGFDWAAIIARCGCAIRSTPGSELCCSTWVSILQIQALRKKTHAYYVPTPKSMA